MDRQGIDGAEWYLRSIISAQYGIWNVVPEELLTSKDRKVAHIIPSRLEHKTEHEILGRDATLECPLVWLENLTRLKKRNTTTSNL